MLKMLKLCSTRPSEKAVSARSIDESALLWDIYKPNSHHVAENANRDKQPPPRRGRKRDRFTGQFSSLTWNVKARFRTGLLGRQLNQFTQHQITKPLGGAYSDSAGGRETETREPAFPSQTEKRIQQPSKDSARDGSPKLSALRELFVRRPRQ